MLLMISKPIRYKGTVRFVSLLLRSDHIDGKCQKEAGLLQFKVAASEVIDNHRSDSQGKLINTLNPIIRGWCNYYSTVVSKETFSKANYATFQMLWAWAKRRHPDKSKKWIYSRYWKRWNGKVEFKADDTDKLLNHHEMPIRRHVKVQGIRSSFDGEWVYWTNTE